MKDYSRKHYTDYQYKDWLRATPSKAVWNSILSQNTGYGEFSVNKHRKSSLASSISLYLKQSERKKPYVKGGFPAMEEEWEGPVGGFTPPGYTTPPFDQPWNTGPPGEGPWSVIFDLEVDGCWCNGETKSFTANGTHPITSLSISLHEAGTEINIAGGIGTNSVIGTLTAVNETGNVNFTASMTSSGGVSGSSNDLVYECGNCDLCLITDDMTAGSNPATIVRNATVGISVINGVGPYNWTVSGTDFTLTYDTTSTGLNGLIAGASACGTATVTVTDDCETVVVIEVRCTSGTWDFKGNYCGMGGATTNSIGTERVFGGKRQVQTWTLVCGFAGSPSNTCGDRCKPADCPNWGIRTECLTFDCAKVAPSASWRGSWPCCDLSHLPGLDGCRAYKENVIAYYEWDCV